MKKERMKVSISFLVAILGWMLFLPASVSANPDDLFFEDGSAVVLQAGGLFETEEYARQTARRYDSAMSDASRPSAREALREGLLARNVEIDIGSYGTPEEGFGNFYFDTLNCYPELFFVKSTIRCTSTGVYTPSYDDSYGPEHQQLFDEAVDAILAQVPQGLNDKQKLLWVHDYLVTHCEYDLTYSNYNAYNVLVDHKAVCQGYALAYRYLTGKLGVDVALVSSLSMNHAWNIAKLDGAYYHIDCTWDDPANHWYEGYCSHENFLKSESALVNETNHTGSDWTCPDLGNVKGLAKSTLYDSYFWKDLTTAIPMAEGYYAYVTSGSFVLRKLNESNSVTVALPNGARPWGYSSVATDGTRFYYNTASALYSVAADQTVENLYVLSEAEKALGSVYGIIVEDNGIAYNLGQAPCNTTFTRKRFELPSTALTGAVTITGSLQFGQTLTASVSESNADSGDTLRYQWKRVDASTNAETVIAGANQASYVPVKEDIGHKLACVVSSGTMLGSIVGTTDEAISKAEGPAAPTGLNGIAASVKGAADGKITGTKAGMEYSADKDFSKASDIKKITGTEVTGLAAGTYYVRTAETDTAKASEATEVAVADGPEAKKAETLEEAAENLTKENVDEKTEDLKRKDTDELLEELQQDEKAVEALEKIEETYMEKHAITEEAPESRMSELTAGKLAMTGAALNMESGSVGLKVEETARDGFEEVASHRNMVVFELNVVAKDADGKEVDFSEDLEVPVTVTIPIPERFDLATIQILHKHKDGTVEKVKFTINEKERTATFTVKHFSPFAITGAAASESMYRMYNPNSGEHFYTAKAAERDMLVSVGWNYEGIAWEAPIYSDIPVYRLYNPNAGDHHYTTSAGERDMLVSVGWNDEGIGWYSDEDEGEVLYRLYNPNALTGTHHYTKSAAERDFLDGIGWNYEGLSWYGVVK